MPGASVNTGVEQPVAADTQQDTAFVPPPISSWRGPAPAQASAASDDNFVPPPISSWRGPAPAEPGLNRLEDRKSKMVAATPGFWESMWAPIRDSAVGRAFHVDTRTDAYRQQDPAGNAMINFGAAIPGSQPGAIRSIADFASGLTTPENAAIMTVTGGAGAIDSAIGKTALSKLISLGFSAQMVDNAAKRVPGFIEAVKAGDWDKVRGIGTSILLETGFAAHGAKHAGTVEPTTPSIRTPGPEPETQPLTGGQSTLPMPNQMAGAVASGVANAVKAVGSAGRVISPAKVEPRLGLVRVYGPGSADSGFSDYAPGAALDFRDLGGVKKIKTNEDVIKAGRATRDHLQDEGLEPYMEKARQAGVMIPTQPLIDATRDALSRTMRLEDKPAAAALVKQMEDAYGSNGVTALGPDAVRELLQENNAELDAFHDRAIGKQNAAVTSGKPEAILKARGDALRKMLYNGLDEAGGGAGPREIQARTGAAIGLLDAALAKRNAILAEKAVSLTEAGKRIAAKAIDIPGKVLKGDLESAIGAFHPIKGESDAMIGRIFENLGPRRPIPRPVTAAPPVEPEVAPPAAAPVTPETPAATPPAPAELPVAAAPTPAPPVEAPPELTPEGARALRQTELEEAFSKPTREEQQAAFTELFSKPRPRDEVNVLSQKLYGRPMAELSKEEFGFVMQKYVQSAFETGTEAPPISPEVLAAERQAFQAGMNPVAPERPQFTAPPPMPAEAPSGTAEPPVAEATPEPPVEEAKPAAAEEEQLPAPTPEAAREAGQVAANPPEPPAIPEASKEPSVAAAPAAPVPGLESGDGLMAPGVFKAPKTQAEVPPPDRDARMATSDLNVDPERFQYKIDAVGPGGVSEKYKGAKYNEEKAGILQVWFDPEDGKTYVINGHHRHGIAVGSEAPTEKVKFIQASDAKAARIQGAIQNIAENQGTALDAAKLFRDSGISGQEAIERYGLSPNAPITKQGLEMAKLSPELFRMAIEEQVPVEQAALIGRELGDNLPAQDQLARRLAKRAAAGQEYSTKTLANLIGLAKGSGNVESDQLNLFGKDAEEESAMDATAAFMSKIRERLSADKRLFGAVAKGENVEKLEGAGNKMAGEKNKSLAEEARDALGTFDGLKFVSGKINELLVQAGREIAGGARPREIEAKYYDQIRQAVADELPGAKNAGGGSAAGNPPANGVGGENQRPGAAGEPEGAGGNEAGGTEAQLAEPGKRVSEMTMAEAIDAFRNLEPKKKDSTLTGEDALVEEAGRFRDWYNKQLAAEAAPAPAQSTSGRIIDTLDKAANDAMARMRQRGTMGGTRAPAGIPVDDVADMAIYGAAKIAKGTVQFAKWSKDMISEIGPHIKPLLKDLYEKAKDIYSRHVDNAADDLPNTKKMMELYRDGKAGQDWYAATKTELEKHFGADADKVIDFLAATSMKNTVAGNVASAIKAFKQWKAGEPFTGFMGKQAEMLDAAVKGEDFGGPKVASFRANLKGDTQAVTIDRWMSRAFGFPDNPSDAQYKFMDHVVSQVARERGIEPRQMQAAIWKSVKEAEQVRGNTSESFENLIARKILSDPDLAEVIRRAREDGDTNAAYGDTEAQLADPFYSKLSRVIDEKMPNKASPEQIRSIVTNTNTGAKADEIQATGFDKWLDDQKGAVSKADVQKFLQGNAIEVKMRTYGGGGKASEVRYRQAEAQIAAERLHVRDVGSKMEYRLRQVFLEHVALNSGFSEIAEMALAKPEDALSPGDLERQRQVQAAIPKELAQEFMAAKEKLMLAQVEHAEAYREYRNNQYSQEPKYSGMTTPGGENYREDLFTFPNKKPEPVKLEWTESEDSKEGDTWIDKSGRYDIHKYSKGWLGFDNVDQNRIKSKVEAGPGLSGKPFETLEEAKQGVAEYANEQASRAPQQLYQEPHWPEVTDATVFAHTRMSDRMTSEGKKALHVDEFQSQLNQVGREEGYSGTTAELSAAKAKVHALLKQYNDLEIKIGERDFGATDAQEAELNRLKSEIDETHQRMQKLKYGVPLLPFNKSWFEHVFKRALRMAAEGDYDKLTWTTGETQAERNSLDRHVSKLTYDPQSETLSGYDHDGYESIRKDVPPEKLGDYVGKEVAQKLLDKTKNIPANPPGTKLEDYKITTERTQYGDNGEYDTYVRVEGPDGDVGTFENEQEAKRYLRNEEIPSRMEHREVATLSGMDLKIGGERKRRLYDEMIPNFANRYAKKWGARVGESEIEAGDNPKLPPYSFQVLRSLVGGEDYTETGKWGVYQRDPRTGYIDRDNPVAEFPTEAEAQDHRERLNYEADLRPASKNFVKVHSIDITPAMKKSVLEEGQPLFQIDEGGTPAPPIGDLFGEEGTKVSGENAAAQEAAAKKLEQDRLTAEFNSPINANNRRKKLKRAEGPVQEDFFAPVKEEDPQGGFEFQRALFDTSVKEKLSAPLNLNDIDKSITNASFRYKPPTAKLPARIYTDKTLTAVIGAINAAIAETKVIPINGLQMNAKAAEVFSDTLRKGIDAAVSEKAKAKLTALADAIDDAIDDHPDGLVVVNGATGRPIWAIRDTLLHETSHIEQARVMAGGPGALVWGDKLDRTPYYKDAKDVLVRHGYNGNSPNKIIREIFSIAAERVYSKQTGKNRIGLDRVQMGSLVQGLLDQAVEMNGPKAYDLIKHVTPSFQRGLLGETLYNQIQDARGASARSAAQSASGSPQSGEVQGNLGSTAKPPVE